MTTAKERLIAALRRAKQRGESCCANTVHHPKVAGRGAKQRIHELRAQGWGIDTVACEDARCVWANRRDREQGRPYTARLAYRLVSEPVGAREKVRA